MKNKAVMLILTVFISLSTRTRSVDKEKSTTTNIMEELEAINKDFIEKNSELLVMTSGRQGWCSSRKTTNLGTDKPTLSAPGQKFDVFLSHSGKQKNFVRQLHRDLTNVGVSCFFDEDPQSLPIGEDFPPRIFEAAKTCRVAVLLLSKEFLESKWPMLEASTFVKARHTNPSFQILPLYFMIAPEALKQITVDNEKWKGFGISEETRVEWHKALNVIRPINALKFSEGGNELEFRDKIVREVSCRLLKQSRRYHVPFMQGEERMCQEVADFFNTVHPNERGIRIAGLYGIAGHGKTTLGKATCNFKLADFEGKVCHLEFSADSSFERLKHALHYLTHRPQSHLQILPSEDQAKVELHDRMKGQRVLLVLDNITEESIDEVKYFLKAELGENSWILLSARSVYVLEKHFQIERKSCMRVPSLAEDEAIGILLERTSLDESRLGAEDRSFVLKCAKRCSFKETSCDISRRGRTFHPLALKAFGGHLFGKYGLRLQKWVAEIDGLVNPSGYGLADVLAVLGKAFDGMIPKYRTIFMLLTVYMLLNMSSHTVTEWLAINCNEEISFVEKAVKDLCNKAFIEESVPGIRIHDLYFEFARSKANEMGRWLWWKGDLDSTRGLSSQDREGFEVVKLEQCKYRSPSQIASKYLQNVLALQLVGVQKMSKLDLGPMNSLRSLALHNCQDLAAIEGMEKLLELAWLQISELHPMFELPELSSLQGLQHLEIDIAVNEELNQLGDLTSCFSLREIKVRCPSLLEFPRLNGLPHLKKVEFSLCDKVKGALDCRDCVELQSVVLDSCCQMVTPPLLARCKKLSKISLSECDAVTACPNIDAPNALKTLELFISSKGALAPKWLEFCKAMENLQLWNMRNVEQLPSLRRLSNLTVLKLGKCGITEPPDLACCVMLEMVSFFSLNTLERFPNFTSLRRLKNLSLYNCRRVEDPPDILGCQELQVLILLYNDNLKGLPRIDDCRRLKQIQVSWGCKDEVVYDGIFPNNWEVDDDNEYFLEHFKDDIFHFREFPEPLKGWRWLKGKAVLGKKYFRGVKMYNSITAPYETSEMSKFYGQNSITLSLRGNKVIAFPTPAGVIENRDWLKKVQEYFAGKEDIASASAASGPVKHVLGSVDAKESTQEKYENGDTALHMAARENCLNKMRQLIEFQPELCCSVNDKGKTPLCIAVKLGHLEAVKQLIESRPDAVTIRNHRGMNVLHLAAQVGQVEVVDYLREMVGLSDLVNQGLQSGDTPLHIAASNENSCMVRSLLHIHGINRGAVNEKGLTALDIARENMKDHKSYLESASPMLALLLLVLLLSSALSALLIYVSALLIYVSALVVYTLLSSALGSVLLVCVSTLLGKVSALSALHMPALHMPALHALFVFVYALFAFLVPMPARSVPMPARSVPVSELSELSAWTALLVVYTLWICFPFIYGHSFMISWSFIYDYTNRTADTALYYICGKIMAVFRFVVPLRSFTNFTVQLMRLNKLSAILWLLTE
ncbi:disease resistance-like protein DSC2 isoform X1 [Cryptomeria japonica]|uniref:disease resistance-like protein DSC2 isoform X1 n=1 Tax=Cryptomeria japonica TaxID=3369 RepID=UPI0027DA93A9|nr:disease resistance-like protein DSC2 isoform X1 [Cryptomeria japonica]